MISPVDALLLLARAAGMTDATAASTHLRESGSIAAAVEGTLPIAGERVRIAVAQHTDFPDTLPKVYLLSEHAIPHIDDDRLVCVFEDEGTLHDHRRDDDLVLETIERARRVIEEGLLGENHADFIDEVEAYWRRGQRVACVIEPDDNPRSIHSLHRDARPFGVADTAAALAAVCPGLKGQARSGLYLPLDPQKVKALHPQRLRSWPTVLAELSDRSLQLAAQTPIRKEDSVLVVLGVPQRSGGHALLGLTLVKFERRGCLLDAVPVRTAPLWLRRFDSARVRGRVPSNTAARRVAVIGCGAVGGHAAHALAWAGAEEVALIDPDTYGPENTLRHVLGRDGWRQPSKVAGLKELLQRQLPGVRVTEVPETAARSLESHADVFSACDAIVVAIGNPSVPLRLNDEFSERRFPVPVIYTWLEPLGIGGHALLVRNGAPGCLRCVFPDVPELHCSVDFAAPGQRYTRRELGCNGIYTPYADLDARETALAAVRLVERVVREPSTPAWLRSWRGDATGLLTAGFKVAPRYDELPAGFDAMLVPRLGCPTCGS